MKKILMKFDVVDRHYCIYIDSKVQVINEGTTYKNIKDEDLEYHNW